MIGTRFLVENVVYKEKKRSAHYSKTNTFLPTGTFKNYKNQCIVICVLFFKETLEKYIRMKYYPAKSLHTLRGTMRIFLLTTKKYFPSKINLHLSKTNSSIATHSKPNNGLEKINF